MKETMLQIMNQYGYLGIIFLIAIENIFPPIPSEVILTFGGFLTTQTNMNVIGVTIFSTAGSLLGAYALYYAGYSLSPSKMEKLVNGKLGKLLHLNMDHILKSQIWFQKHGKNTVFFCRFIPIIRSLISIPAGMARMDIGIFAILTVLGSFFWNLILVSLGAAAGSSWDKISLYINEYSSAVKWGMALILIFLLFNHFRKKRKQK